ncbi:hypothetical protein LJR220_003417 [Bradyrhizobium sp. LjRoot220]|uniref:hypothetical protein n=1 Tax=Bradyrhizobium sp. LjRoot220 TaxID=3342284 RepID=UPI003ECDFF2B
MTFIPHDVPLGIKASAPPAGYRRFVVAIFVFLLMPPAAFAALTIAVDPYFVWGAPSWPGVNVVRPTYEPQVVMAKPYQVARLRPSAVALGSSRVEVGIDPRHKGWAPGTVFNFALPSSNSYAVMLAFLHAQKHGAPLKQAVVGLDFFAFNINFPLASTLTEQRFHESTAREFAQYLALRNRVKPKVASDSTGDWNEALYLAVNADVTAAVIRKDFKSGREHFELAGRTERRKGATVPADWDETGYLQVHPDVAAAVKDGSFISGYHHWLAAGQAEKRLGGFRPADWDEERYLAANPFVRIRIARGEYRDGYLHYVATGRKQGLIGAGHPADMLDRLILRFASLGQAIFHAKERFSLVFSTTTLRDAISTLRRQAEPADFNSEGMRVWHGQEAVLDRIGGPGAAMRTRLLNGPWNPMLVPPARQYCFTKTEAGMTTFDPFRFMIQKAHAEGTDLRLFITPLHAVVRTTINALGLGERYAFWVRELVRINEEEASKAGRQPFPLWDFSAPGSVTAERIPEPGDRSPMRWFWEWSHYRKETGDLILDRLLEHGDPARVVPADFGVRLTTANIEAHLANGAIDLSRWAARSDLASNIAREAGKPGKFNRQAEATCW